MNKLLGTLLILAVAQNVMAGDVGIGLRMSHYDEIQAETIGLDLTFELEEAFRLNPNIEYFLVDDAEIVMVNLDVLYDFRPEEKVNPYVGGGIGVALLTVDDPILLLFGGTDEVANAVAGVEFTTGAVKPYFRAKYSWFWEASNGDVSIAAGVRF